MGITKTLVICIIFGFCHGKTKWKAFLSQGNTGKSSSLFYEILNWIINTIDWWSRYLRVIDYDFTKGRLYMYKHSRYNDGIAGYEKLKANWLKLVIQW